MNRLPRVAREGTPGTSICFSVEPYGAGGLERMLRDVLKGRRLGLSYALHGSNLQQPAKGRLRLLFR